MSILRKKNLPAPINFGLIKSNDIKSTLKILHKNSCFVRHSLRTIWGSEKGNSGRNKKNKIIPKEFPGSQKGGRN
jgi:hypothetical protein